MKDNNQPLREESQDIRFSEPTFIDPLTGLFNRYYLYQFLPEEIKKAELGKYSLSVFMIDLDNFKEINDTHGHLSGDEVLKQLAQLLKKSFRQSDMIIRYAGDEFTVLLPAMDLDKAQSLAQRVIESVDNTVFKGKSGEDIHLTISIGISTYPQDANETDKLIDLADKALYLSKEKGKNRISCAKEVTLETLSSLVALDSFPCPKFINREEEITKLKSIFETIVLKSNILQVVFISGDTGVGKTRILNEINEYLRKEAIVINYYSSPAHFQNPYYLFSSGLSEYIESIGVDNPQLLNILSQIPSEELVELSRIIPVLSEVVRIPELKSEEKRFLLFKGFLDILIGLNKVSPLVLSFDDIHWGDKASLELIRYLIKEEKNKRIFIVCTFSEENIIENSTFKDLFDQIRLESNFLQIKLSNFGIENTSEMIGTIFPGLEKEKEFCELIHEVTKGNPSFIEEVLKSLIENAVIFYQDNQWQIKENISAEDIPSSMEEVIKKRIKNLDEETKEMIVQAAVIGEDFSLNLLKKVGEKEEGFILEVLKRAKKMRLVDEISPKGKFGFINKNVRNVLYNELNDEQRNLLHYKIGRALAEEHKDNLYNVAGEVSFHFSKVPKDKITQYSQMISERVSRTISPTEILDYLDKLAREISLEEEEKEKIPFLTDRILKETIGLVRALQGAVKVFSLYPPGTMRINSVREVLLILDRLWKDISYFNLAEIEKNLVINGRRLSPKEIEQANLGYFLNLMMEHSLKTISFNRGLSQEELDKFIQFLSQTPTEIRDKGGWQEVLKDAEIKNIKVDEVRFVLVDDKVRKGFEEKKRLEDIMLMEFLVGKIEQSQIDKGVILNKIQKAPKEFAQAIMRVAEEIVKQGKATDEAKVVNESLEKINSQILSKDSQAGEYAKELANVILELKPTLRNKVIRDQFIKKAKTQKEEKETSNITDSKLAQIIPDEVIIDMVMEEFKESQGNLLVVKSSLDKILPEEQRRKEVFPKLEENLLKIKLDKESIDFILGRIKWEELSLEKQLENVLKFTDKFYLDEIDKIKLLLKELYLKQKKQELEKLVYHLITKASGLEYKISKALMLAIVDFIESAYLREDTDIVRIKEEMAGLWKRIDIEVEPKNLSLILDVFRNILKSLAHRFFSQDIILELEKPLGKRYGLLVYKLFYHLSHRFKWEKERNVQISKIIYDFIIENSEDKFIAFFIYSIVNYPFEEKINLADFLTIWETKLLDILIDLASLENIGWFDSFREYIIKKKLIELLKELDKSVLEELKQRLSGENVSVSLIKLAGDLKNYDLLEGIIPHLKNKDPLIRRATVLALANIGGDKSIEALSELLEKEKDRSLYNLIKSQLKILKERK